MSELVLFEDKNTKKASKKGREIYETNENMKTLADIMENTDFKKLLYNNFNNWDDIKTIIMLMKTYQLIEMNNPDINKFQKLYILNTVIKNGEYRNNIAREFQNWIKSSHQNMLKF